MKAIGWCALALGAAACWVEPLTTEGRPPLHDPLIPISEPTGGAQLPPGIEPAPDGTTPAGPGPQLTDPDYAPPVAVRALLPGNLRAVSRLWPRPAVPGEGTAHVLLTLPNRLPRGASRGVALMTARMVATSPGGPEGRTALLAAIERLGGHLATRVDSQTTSFEISVPAAHWRAAVGHLVEAVQSTPSSPQQLARAQEQLVVELRDGFRRDPMAAAVQRVLGGGTEGVEALLTDVQDLTATRTALFHGRTYRPSGAVLALLVPGAEPVGALCEAERLTRPWTATETGAFPEPLPKPPAANGIVWAARPGRSQVALLYELPLASGRDAAAAMVALECLSWSGVGGRIGLRLADAFQHEVGFEDRSTAEGARNFIELRTEADPAHVTTLYDLCRTAARSLLSSPPAGREVEVAARRARLRLLEEQQDPGSWAYAATRRVLAGAPQTVRVTADGVERQADSEPDPLVETLAALASPLALDCGTAYAGLANRLPLLVVVGGEPAGQAASHVALLKDAFVETPGAEVVETDEAAQTESGREVMELAMSAVGGRQLLAAQHGCRSASGSRTGRGPSVDDQEWFLLGRRLRQVREILGTTIEIVVDQDGGSAIARGEKRAVSKDEARAVLNAAARHPMFLLGAYARGETAYRLVSRRRIGDRPMAVLERAGDRSERLRLYVDAQSGLVRVVESQERRPIGLVFLREEYRDYRSMGGVRVPFHRTTYVDDTVRGTVTEWREFKPEKPSDEDLQPGGPAK